MEHKEKSVSYILITAARNEEAYIENTIKSVISQTLLPKAWVIVSDGSTDHTDEIVKQYATNHDFIRLVRRETDTSRNFASKVYAIRAGIDKLNGTEYDFIGSLDADITLQPDYYERLFEIFRENPKLGVAGGIACELHNKRWLRQHTNVEWSVAGGTQMFRRQCYDDIGGYLPLHKGGEDAIAEVMARKHRWQTKTFPQLEVFHHRESGTASCSFYSARMRLGTYRYSLGYMLWFEIARCLARMRKSYILAELLTLWGYILALLRRDKIVVPDDIRKYIRHEQLHRLRSVFHIERSKPGKTEEFLTLYKYHKKHTVDNSEAAIRGYMKFKTRVVEPFFQPLKKRLLILDVGCGKFYPFSRLAIANGHIVTALDTQYVAPRIWKYFAMLYYDGMHVAVKSVFHDVLFLPAFKKKLKSTVQHSTENSEIMFVRASAENIPFPDDYFDVVFSCNAFEHIKNIERAISECARVVKPNGIIYISTHPYTSISGSHHPAWFHPDSEPPKDIPSWFHLRNDCEKPVWLLDYGLNKYRLADYRNVFTRYADIIAEFSDKVEGASFLTEQIRLELKGFSEEELLTSTKTFLMRKPPVSNALLQE
jgi:glycosyltransferase involved in cell wall biosynthesis